MQNSIMRVLGRREYRVFSLVESSVPHRGTMYSPALHLLGGFRDFQSMYFVQRVRVQGMKLWPQCPK